MKTKKWHREGTTTTKAPNFSEEKTTWLQLHIFFCGSHQSHWTKVETFWLWVHKKFCWLQQKELNENDHTIHFSTEDSIKRRWKKKSKSVKLWDKHYRYLKAQDKNGWNQGCAQQYCYDNGAELRFEQ
jgi:hypothetical protein